MDSFDPLRDKEEDRWMLFMLIFFGTMFSVGALHLFLATP